MKLESLSQHLEQLNRHPPVEKWNPPFCGDMDIVIKSDGSWHYMGTPIGRQPLVKLFASVLLRQDGEYFLVTPVEKVRIQVEDAPFVVLGWRQETTERGQTIVFTTNVDDEFVLSEQHSLSLPAADQSAPLYLNIHRSMQAAVHRNVYYQLVAMAEETTVDGKTQWSVKSGGSNFVIGNE